MTLITVGDLKRVLAYFDDATDVVLLHNEQETDWEEHTIAIGEGDNGALVISAEKWASLWKYQCVTDLTPLVLQLREEHENRDQSANP